MKIIFYVISILSVSSLVQAQNYGSKAPSFDVTFCQFKVADSLKDAHASFTIGFSFKIDKNGKTRNLRRTIGTQVSQDQIQACISKWDFPNVEENSSISAFLRWEHAIGWTDLTITGKNFSQKIKIEGERCPYRATASVSSN